MKIIGIIPARFASTRFPGKPLADIAGKTLIQRVYEQAIKAQRLAEVIVATDDERIFQHVQSFGGKAAMTLPSHRSGTDRCAELAAQMPTADAILNIQGDEPFIEPAQIDLAAAPLEAGHPISTLAKRIEREEDLHNPNVVKVVWNQSQEALYFSRSPIPHLRGLPPGQWLAHGDFYKHIGLYGFSRETLLDVAALPLSRYEQMESLEQLRWLEAGYPIVVGITKQETIGVDTPEDLERARAIVLNVEPE
jgi:3-deoxy-manno-octulosonate cytidylyltransferase (CMP-KDO synthetase)